MFEKKILSLVGAVGGTNLLVTLLTAFLVTGGVAGPIGPAGSPGVDGSIGLPGSDGTDGETPYIGSNGNWWIGSSDTGVSAEAVTLNEEESFIVEPFDLLEDSITPTELQSLNMDTVWDDILSDTYTPVSTEAELAAMVRGGKYILANDITLTTPWTPLGYNDDPFSIQLNGNGKTISGLVINGDAVSLSSVGFFSRLEESIVFDLTFEAPEVNKPQVYTQAGVLAGQISLTYLKNITIEGGEVNGVKEAGMLAGRIWNSEVQGIRLTDNTITAISYAGALAYNVTASLVHDVIVTNLTYEPNFDAAYAIGFFDFLSDVGGLIGYAENVELADITITDSTLDFINGSYPTGHKYRVYSIGGVVGRMSGDGSYNSNFLRLHNILVNNTTIMGQVVGGIIGSLEDGSIILSDTKVLSSDVYSGDISDETDTVDLSNLTASNYQRLSGQAGGLIGDVESSGVLIVDAYVEANISGDSSVGGYIGDFSGDYNSYEFLYIKNSVSDSSIFVSGSEGGGFAGYLTNLAYVVIENSANLSNVQSFYDGNYANELGGFVGSLYEIDRFVLFSNSYNAGNVVGEYQIGGLVGYNEVEGFNDYDLEDGGLILYNVYNSGDVYGDEDVGGFIGQQYDQDNVFKIYNSLQAGMLYEADGSTPDFSSNEHGAFVGENTSSNSAILTSNAFYLELTGNNETLIPTVANDNSSSIHRDVNGSSLPLTGFVTLLTSGSTGGTVFNPLTNLDAFTNASAFYFDGIWNFDEAWTFDFTQDGLPTLIHSYRQPD